MCLRPINIRLDRSDFSRAYRPTSFISVPCGNCVECLKDRQNSWKIRLLSECSSWKHLYFFTLTYSEETVPRNDKGATTASVSDIQNWLKRFRTSLDRSIGKASTRSHFRYFIAAEYAPDGVYITRSGVPRKSTCRPHYHGLIYSDLPLSDVRPLFRDWSSNYGYVKFDEVAISSSDSRGEYSSVANYVSKYCCKGEFASRKDEIERGEISRAFSLMSKGIGENYVYRFKSHHLHGLNIRPDTVLSADEVASIVARRFVLDGSFKYKMPRYYIDRIYRVSELKERQVWNYKLKKYETKFVKRFTSNSFLCNQISRFLESRVLSRSAHIFEELDELARCGEIESEKYKILLQSLNGFTPEYLSSREASLSSKLRNFYKVNSCRNSALCFCQN